MKGRGNTTWPTVQGIGIIPNSLVCNNRYRAGIFKQYMEARNRVGIGLSYGLGELIPWNLFMGSIKV